MVDKQHRNVEPLPHCVQHLGEMRGLLSVESSRRLVEEDQPRPHREGAGELDAPLDPGRQIAGEGPRVAVEVEHVQDRSRALSRRTLRVTRERKVERVAERVAPAQRVHRHDQVLLHGHRAPQLQVLKSASDAEPRAFVHRRVSQRVVVEIDRPCVRPDDAGDAVEERGLARAVGPDEAEDLAAVQVQRHAIESDDAAKPHGQVAHAEHRHATFTLRPPTAPAADRACRTRLRRSPHTPSGSAMSWTMSSTPTAI